MAYNSKVVKKVLTDMENKEKKAILDAKKRKDELYRKLPELRELDEKLIGTYKEIMDSISRAMNPVDDSVIELDDIKAENQNLQKMRKLILEQHGYSADYTEPVYSCKNCSDTGYRNDDICTCLKRALAIESVNESGFGETIKSQNFKNFSLEYYKTDTSYEAECNPYEQMATVFEQCINYAKTFGKSNSPVKHLIFVGGTGLGKTHMSSAIAGEIIKKGYDVYYNSAQNILSSFEKERFSYRNEFDTDIIERYMSCDLLIIDDLGTEYTGSVYATSLYGLINARLAANKAMIITTNLGYEDMRRKYDERIVSRIAGEFATVYFVGDDIRLLKE